MAVRAASAAAGADVDDGSLAPLLAFQPAAWSGVNQVRLAWHEAESHLEPRVLYSRRVIFGPVKTALTENVVTRLEVPARQKLLILPSAGLIAERDCSVNA